MTRDVTGADKRQWVVRSRFEWRSPATSDDFEHDVSVGSAAAIVLLVVVVTLGAVLILWTPEDVVVPLWVVMLILLTILFFPTRWALRRPWTVVAETDDTGVDDQGRKNPREVWVGTVRGVFTARQQFIRVARSIEVDSAPGLEGPLQPVA